MNHAYFEETPNPFFEACKSGTAQEVASFLAKGSDVHAREIHFKGHPTPLMAAIWSNDNPLICETLIKAGSDLNLTFIDGWSILMDAVYKNRSPRTIRALLEAGADPNACGEDGWTPLIAAINGGCSPSSIKLLLDAGADPNVTFVEDEIDGSDVDEFYTPLALALFKHAPITTIKYLLDAGAYVDFQRGEGEMSLPKAVTTNYSLSEIKFLVSRGVDIFAKDKYIFYVWECTKKFCRSDVFTF